VNPSVLWPELSGAVSLLVGLVASRRAWSTAPGLDKMIALGPVFVAAPLATFGAEHMVSAKAIVQMIPVWMPLRLFWTYFVGAALFATGTSFVLRKNLRLSATLYGLMILLFVLLLHAPNVAAHPQDRFAWAVALRDLTFGVGALAFAAAQPDSGRQLGTMRVLALIRRLVAVPLLFFAVEHFLHPEFAPGVPLPKQTPVWFPAPALWGDATAVILLAAAAAFLLDRRARTAATALGVWLALLTAFLYLPFLAANAAAQTIEDPNYVADTLLFAGTMLVLAGASTAGRDRSVE
jgi:uncharacterized membrane protein